MGLSILLHYILLRTHINPIFSSYIALSMGICLIIVLEVIIPFKKSWIPNRNEIKTDIIFVLFIQLLLPKILTLFIAITLLNILQKNGYVLNDYWIHESPIFLQVILMLVVAEFFRYWLHRASHNWIPLWRLHAVHHSPNKLYWLNTSRFHPIEKSIQFLFDALPFILLGVSSEVVSTYFVFYAINGFFQHSNIKLNMGWLNYIISSPQLHRWHHSKIVNESNNNYGNNLIIWDIIFRTWFLPKKYTVNELGLINRFYPMSFKDQMKTPFISGIDRKTTNILSFREIFSNVRIKFSLLIVKYIYQKPFERSLYNPMKYQNKILMNIMDRNKNSEYGKDHGFNKINSYKKFITEVPIQDYEALRSYIQNQEENKHPYLTSEQPKYYAVTSGTTGLSKYIPVIKQTIHQHQRALAIYACAQNKVNPEVFYGKLLAIPGAYCEGKLSGGSTFGSISGLLYYLMPKLLQKKYVVPNNVFSLKNHILKYQLIIRLALQYSNLSYIVSANPSTFIKLMEIMNINFERYVDDIRNGQFFKIDDLPNEIKNNISSLLSANVQRADELQSLVGLNRDINYRDIWPNLKLISTWKGGSCGVTINTLKKMLPEKTYIMELGYISSELRGTIPLPDTNDSGVPTLHDAFFEFIEMSKYEDGCNKTLTLKEIEVGKMYFIIITTPAGLYRYFMNDIIEVTGFKKATPLIRFIQKGKGVTNITGEKLSENQLILAMQELHSELNNEIPFYIAITSIENSCYKLFIELDVNIVSYRNQLDDKLQKLNTEYSSKRSSGRLNIINIYPVKNGTGNEYKKYIVSKGQRESQLKYMLLQHENDSTFNFEEYLL